MPYLVLGVLLLIGFLLLARGFVAADPKSLVRVFKWSGLGIGGALVVYLALTRQLGQAIALAMLLAP
ncbi:MAG TPA: molecular chaperone DnaJ, partial [Alphaproteobacteria bacterium]